ncbi:hypothetical protein DSLPV1_073 [Dishui lake phycodnavirus 1]|uniref:hypothetical protein n=1 Tax=Dishui lake phycodnavirus 1 TaxID=2079134 RepID=UPI000CD68894|nr:hypothetical protein C5Y57_gp073 [Dishui lake phycodnavirus 1]AUT19044.1 hypothetical protein DSLPV1_073 [Dishui lake phycodnavirus 1]
METDIGQPIDYNPNIHLAKEPPLSEQHHLHHHGEDTSPIDEYLQPPHMYMEPPSPMYYQQPPPMHMNQQSFDITSLDKNTYLMAFVAFLLGFFMGKTMISPVIFRNP